ncbi:hypothetical protein [Billgrantia kenyensis]|uniref:Uncharacterized protein n=1 Tax=Billgrantia kenyensis TaxID=321266 RepID=A0A7W0AG73_9GAMM|nr:hypothetical protein [Halomonas kenyensis]MBA2781106.1 hypothetical protein [Halomonas kenyensis]MCG6663819.1 hypothetical protein [Halomonas kenyensis]
MDYLLGIVAKFFNRHDKLTLLSDELANYLSDPENIAAQLRLESAFYQAFRKPASAKLVGRLASLNCGPMEALTTYGRVSQVVACDFSNHSLKVGKWFDIDLWLRVVLTLGFGITLIMVGLIGVSFGFFSLYSAVGDVYLNGFEAVFSQGVQGYAWLFIMVGFGGILSLFGVFLVYTGWDLISSLESEGKALKLIEQLAESEKL